MNGLIHIKATCFNYATCIIQMKNRQQRGKSMVLVLHTFLRTPDGMNYASTGLYKAILQCKIF